MASCGYMENILEVDLSSGLVEKVTVDPDLMREYLGGTGFITKVLYDRQPPGIDPLSPESLFIVAAGPLVGTLAPTASRVEITAKSPLTGMLGMANGGGHWAPMLRYAGYEAIIVRGSSATPVYLWINNGTVELRSAAHLWGLDVWETVDRVRSESPEHSPDRIRVLAIGPAGENRVRYASITVDYHNSASRCGLGAVMGAKKLKAIAVTGDGAIKVAHPSRLEEAAWEFVSKGDPHMYGNPGPSYIKARSLAFVDRWEASGGLPAKNWQTWTVPNWKSRTLEVGLKYVRPAAEACHCCFFGDGCAEVKEGKYAGVKVGDIHSQPVLTWGAMCAIEDMAAIYKCQEMCERLGMDIPDVGQAIALAMELFQKGILTKADTGGLALEWGDEDLVQQLIELIAHRQGIGHLLAEGSERMASTVGRGAEKCSITVKGMTPCTHEYRSGINLGLLGHLSSPRGGDNVRTAHEYFHVESLPRIRAMGKEGMSHEEYVQWFVEHKDMFDEVKAKAYGNPPRMGPYSHEQRAYLLKWMEDESTLHNCLGTCILSLMGPTTMARLYSAVTGWEVSPWELMRIGEKVITLQRILNAREGIRRGDVDLPGRFYDEPIPEGPARGKVLSRDEVRAAMDAYYRVRGWDVETGMPTRRKLEELGLGDIVDSATVG